MRGPPHRLGTIWARRRNDQCRNVDLLQILREVVSETFDAVVVFFVTASMPCAQNASIIPARLVAGR